MKVLITIQHPAHVHFFKNTVKKLREQGNEVHVVAREKEITTELLDAYDIPHTVLAGEVKSSYDVIRIQLKYEINLFKYARKIKPDLLTAIGEPGITHVAKLLGTKSLLFTDTEHTRFQNYISVPFADRICTPSSYSNDLGERHTRYDGYHELAYLHPNQFEPDKENLKKCGVDPDEEYYVIRTIGWNAFHDRGKMGLSKHGLERITETLSNHGQVYITSEVELPGSLKDYKLTVPSHYIHDLLYYADGYIGDSGTMATEAAILGTPVIRADPFAAGQDGGNFVELEEKYNLMFSTPDERTAIEKLPELINNSDHSKVNRTKELFDDKIDVTEFILTQIRSLAKMEPQEKVE
ncbi:DUF354 domain-containing protein [Haloferax sp. YSSS75]|uniref:DUF354 domain-containing protein n=1 Tax=Haloferax sp. YSSS75 TaxID=3388564 RepID=UPI00398CAAC1